MIRGIVLVAYLFTQFLLASAFKYEDIPEDYRELIPQEAKDFMMNLSDADKTTLKEVFKGGPYKNEEEAIAELKKKSTELGERAEKFHAAIKAKVTALGPEAKTFAEKSIDIGRKLRARYYTDNKPTGEELKEKTAEVLKMYKSLSEDGKADFQKQFPILTKVFTSEKLAKFVGVEN
ncbi:hypothetical protein RB195_011850 [Necator americanus]